MQREFIQQATKFADVVIHPKMEGLGWMEFEKMEKFIEKGQIATEEKLPEIKKLIAF